ncbi:MAG: hypothetical protein J0G97_06620, partial [Rhizobium pusense]|nr:hypothetical protein [Agrobacterium pusense]
MISPCHIEEGRYIAGATRVIGLANRATFSGLDVQKPIIANMPASDTGWDHSISAVKSSKRGNHFIDGNR